MRNDEKLAIQVTDLRRPWRTLLRSEPRSNLFLSLQGGYYVCLDLFGGVGGFVVRFIITGPTQSRCHNQH